ncbi:MAG: hypothetical protein HRT72_13715 [Flavobacteriales bacterium]|nr:hypothetical protein [Flavobacteriales bacterium]
MNFIKTLTGFLALIVTILFSKQIDTLAADVFKISWTSSFVLPRFFVLAYSILLAFQIKRVLINKSKLMQYCVVIGIFLVFPAAHFAMYPIYEGDFDKVGQYIDEETFAENSLVQDVNDSLEGFEGLICIASPTCPHCVVAVRKLTRSKDRFPENEILVYMFSKDKEKVEQFKDYVGADNLMFRLVPESEGALKVCMGAFPSFVYFKENRIVHRWMNGDFGFRALDWIEAGLD